MNENDRLTLEQQVFLEKELIQPGIAQPDL